MRPVEKQHTGKAQCGAQVFHACRDRREVGEGHGEGGSSCKASEWSAQQGEDQVRTEGHYPERRDGQDWSREAMCLGRPLFALPLPFCWEAWRLQARHCEV